MGPGRPGAALSGAPASEAATSAPEVARSGRSPAGIAASAPGKLILMGEHAVVYGHPALVAAVDLRLHARIRPASGKAVDLRLRPAGHHERLTWEEVSAYARGARQRWERYAADPRPEDFAALRGDDPAHVTKVALGEAARFLGEREGPPLALEVESEIPVGSGFGSSAALAVAVAGAYLAWRGAEPSPGELEEVALEAERRQHGFPSGVDGATAVRGGLVWAERGEGVGLRFRRLEGPAPRLEGFVAFDTGSPAEPTGAVVAAVRARVEEERARLDGVLAGMGEITVRFRDLLCRPEATKAEIAETVRAFERGLEELGVVPGPARALIRKVEAAGGAAKISGAGALTAGPEGRPGAGTLLAYHPEPGAPAGWDFLAALPRLDVSFGAPGFRLEPPGR